MIVKIFIWLKIWIDFLSIKNLMFLKTQCFGQNVSLNHGKVIRILQRQ